MKSLFAGAAALLLIPAAALAAEDAATAKPEAEQAERAKRWEACKSDIEKFCATVEKGKGQIRTCLEGHAAEVTDACKTRLSQHPNHDQQKPAAQ